MRATPIIAAVLAGCFSPSYRTDLACGPDGDCPPGLVCGEDDLCRDEDAINPGDSPDGGGGGGGAPPNGAYVDKVGDATGGGLDIGRITASIDMHSALKMRIETPNAPRSTTMPADTVVIALDTDQDLTTGDLGYEYRIIYDGSATPPFHVQGWTDDGWIEHFAVLDGAFRSGGIDLELGGALVDNDGDMAFDFVVLSFAGLDAGDVADVAPDDGPVGRYSYKR